MTEESEEENYKLLYGDKIICWILATFIGPSLIILSILGICRMDNIITNIALIIISIIYIIGSIIVYWNKNHGIAQIIFSILIGIIISSPALYYITNDTTIEGNDIAGIYVIPFMIGMTYFILSIIVLYEN